MRLIPALLIAALAFAAAPASAAENYEALLTRAKSGDPALDYRALRDAYAASAHYQPYGGDTDDARTTMIKAFNAQDCTTALPAADKVLDAIYIDITAHLVSGRCFEMAGDKAKADFHRAIAHGLMDSIVASGDGKTEKTAFLVVTINEEYDVLSALRWRLVGQALINDDGHAFDKMEVKSATSAETATLYFQIDRPMAWLSHSLQ
jgi:hypothetical protein